MVNCNQGSFNSGIMTYEDAMKKVQELTAERNALADKLARSEDYCIGVDSERMDYIGKCNALAAENAALKEAIETHSVSVHFCELCGKDDPCITDDVCRVLNQTPATDAAIAEIKALGADACVKALVTSDDDDFCDAPNVCAMVAYSLRRGGAE